MKWEKVKLGDICKSIADGDHQAPKKQESGIPFITISNIDSNNRIDFTNCLYVSEEYYDAINDKRKASKDDILYSVVGSFGVPVLIKENLKFAFQRHIAILRPDTEKIFPAFMYYCILARDFYLQADSVAIGSAQRTITLGALNNMQLSLPPLPVQQRIASILSAYDDLIENNKKQIKLLEEAAQRLYKEWFVDLRFPGHEYVKVVDGVPEGWESCKLRDVAEINGRNIDENYPYDKINYIDIGSVRNGRILEKTNYNLEEAPGRAKRIVQDGDVIWGMVRPNLRAYAMVLNPDKNDVFSTGFAVLTSKKVPFSFLYCNVTTEEFVGYLVNCTNGAAYPAVKPIHFEEYNVSIPQNNLLNKFHNITEPYFRKIYYLNKQISSLREARDRLLPKLMSGEIEV